jgi:tetratricopeptide (TPR) repeat protein
MPQARSHEQKIYNSLDEYSISQHLAFYLLYPSSNLSKECLQYVKELIRKPNAKLITDKAPIEISALSQAGVELLATILEPQKFKIVPLFSEEDWVAIESLAKHLAHHKLKGHYALTEEEILKLPDYEVDLARAILITQLPDNQDKVAYIHYYEALLDIMALQVQAYAKGSENIQDILKALNHLIFKDLQFRFPPYSLSTSQIEQYTVLPTVLDSHRGVCLGVSTLYICLAQRLNIPLEIVTPPGHIYIRYRGEGQLTNIETTARGIHIPTENYMDVNTYRLTSHSIKSVIGMVFYNQASQAIHNKEFGNAIHWYEKALNYLDSHSMRLKELLGYSYVFNNQEEEGKRLLKESIVEKEGDSIHDSHSPQDYLEGHVNEQGLLILLEPIGEDRTKQLLQKEKLKDLLKIYPKFKDGWLELGSLCASLGGGKEAIEALIQYHHLDSSNPSVEYYLAELYFIRYDYKNAWFHLKIAEQLTSAKNYYPNDLKQLRLALLLKSSG